jgi:hypothetical protein
MVPPREASDCHELTLISGGGGRSNDEPDRDQTFAHVLRTRLAKVRQQSIVASDSRHL